jgi:hypothetical protein
LRVWSEDADEILGFDFTILSNEDVILFEKEKLTMKDIFNNKSFIHATTPLKKENGKTKIMWNDTTFSKPLTLSQ